MSFKLFLDEMRLSRYMNDFDGNLFKFSHKNISLPDYNKIKKLLKAEAEELEGSGEEYLIEALIVDGEHVLTYDESESIIYSNYEMKYLYKGKISK